MNKNLVDINDVGKVIGYITYIIILILLFIFWPFVIVWAVNTLFPSVNIILNIWTWIAIHAIGIFTRCTNFTKSSDSK